MFKKIVLGALLVGLIGVLIVGAVVRTNAVAGNGAVSESGGRGRTAESAAAVSGEPVGSRGGFGQGGGQGRTETAPAPLAGTSALDWRTVTGTVVSVADDLVEIKTEAGEVIPFEGRPLSFAQEQGFRLKVGDVVALAGYDEAGEFKLGKVTSLGSGLTVTLRDASGRPGWSGAGRRG